MVHALGELEEESIEGRMSLRATLSVISAFAVWTSRHGMPGRDSPRYGQSDLDTR